VDLFLRERLANISNLIYDPKLRVPPSKEDMEKLLLTLRNSSNTFVDIDFFDSTGNQIAYAGPYPSLEKKNYSKEPWFISLKSKPDKFITTDIYLGFRKQPHFTLAVNRILNNHYIVLRTTLDPKKFYNYLSSLEGSKEIHTSIVNQEGYYQLSPTGITGERSLITPAISPKVDSDKINEKGKSIFYAYAWLNTCNWAVIVQWVSREERAFLTNIHLPILAFSVMTIILILVIIIIRAKMIVHTIREADQTRAQLSDSLLQASKLAAVGELASGIAHEINNPLAIINEEVGLIQDAMDPNYQLQEIIDNLPQHLDNIKQAVFRCRDITYKLLTFVRKSEMNLQNHNIHELLDEVITGFYKEELAVSEIKIIRNYTAEPVQVQTDKNQIQQVFLNLINNAIDALEGSGEIIISTAVKQGRVKINISDTGKGMTQEELEKIFMPFYTTKKAGKGTGLGLSISYGIIKNLNGKISAESVLMHGSTFTLDLPEAKNQI
jgi:two-component system NtrC family sensor kinase